MAKTELLHPQILSPDNKRDYTEGSKNKAFTIAYTPRFLFGGGEDSFINPYTKGLIRSGQPTRLHIDEGAFSLQFKSQQHEQKFRKLCNLSAVAIPTHAEEIPKFVRSQIEDIKDSEGNTHFENHVLFAALFPPSGKENHAISLIKSLTAPKKPDGCSESTGFIDGQEINIHLHAGYQGNNKRVLTMFALLGHKPSLALLEKWVENEKSFVNLSQDSALHMVNEIITRKENELENKKEQEEEKELTPEERADSLATIVFAKALDETQDSVITKEFETISTEKFVGEINIHKEQSQAIRDINETYTQAFTKTLKIFREERDVSSDTLTLLLAKMHDPLITVEDLKKHASLAPKTNKDAALLLAKAMEIDTRPNEKKFSEEEQQMQQSIKQLQQDKGIFFFQLGTNHETPYHLEQTQNGNMKLCAEHAKESDAKIQQATKAVVQSVKTLVAKKGKSVVRKKFDQQTHITGGGGPQQKKDFRQREQKINQQEIKIDSQEVPLSASAPIQMMLRALGSKRVIQESEILEKKEAWDERFESIAEVVYHAASFTNKQITAELEKLSEDKYLGEIIITEKLPDAFIEKNEKLTETFAKSLQKLRKQKDIDRPLLIRMLVKLHDGTIDEIAFTEKLPAFETLTNQEVIRILALDMEIRTRPRETELSSSDEKIQSFARRINKEKKLHFVNLTKNHNTAYHLEELHGGRLESCPEHTPEADKKLEKIKDTVVKKAAILARKTRAQFPSLRRFIGGGPTLYNKSAIAEKKHPKLIENTPKKKISEKKPLIAKQRANQPRTVSPPKMPEHQLKKTPPPPLESKTKKEKEQLFFIVRRKDANAPLIMSKATTKNPIEATDTLFIRSDESKNFMLKNKPLIDRSSTTPRFQIRDISPEGELISITPTESHIEIVQTIPTVTRKALPAEVQIVLEEKEQSNKTESFANVIPFPTQLKPSHSLLEMKSAASVIDQEKIKTVRAALQEITSDMAQTKSMKNDSASSAGEAQLVATSKQSKVNLVKKSVPRETYTSWTTNESQSLVAQVVSLAAERKKRIPTEETDAPKSTKSVPVTQINPRLKMVTTETGAKVSAPDSARIITVTSAAKKDDTRVIVEKAPVPQQEKPLVYIDQAETGSSEETSMSANVSTTKDRTKATTIRKTRKPQSPKPPQTFSPDYTVKATKTEQKTKTVSGENTAKQVAEAFTKKEEEKVAVQVSKQLEQATTKQEKKETKHSVHHDAQASSTATEKITKIKVGTEERFVTERIARATTQRIENKEKIEEKAHKDIARATHTEIGTNETTAQANTSQQKTQTAPVILSSQRKSTRQTQSQQSSMTAQVVASDGHHLPMDPYGARDAFKDALAEIARAA